ncbi:unnamed protein product [Clonostachys rosea f. rosea IK726]|uniref:alpha-L-rhamnosidase n=2 Tax=Bionectria ochroleuca TaxID=29856 RepID=A0A0B7JMJ3_BIOOC|nr:unnamed protein product [Clonostachys rosea f. rosea IK726]
MATVSCVWLEHYHEPSVTGIHESRPRLSWQVENALSGYTQRAYEVEVTEQEPGLHPRTNVVTCSSSSSRLVPWPFDEPLVSRQRVAVRLRVFGSSGEPGPWSKPVRIEVGLLRREDWQCNRIAASWRQDETTPGPEHLFRKTFHVNEAVQHARLYITAQGVYEAELNGSRIGDHFMAPGWTTYDNRLQYQTYDVTGFVKDGANCLGARVAEGWFSGRLGFDGGKRNIWGSQVSLLAQLEMFHPDGRTTTVLSDGSWSSRKGPIQLAEIYDGEKYDAALEDPQWSQPVDQALTANSALTNEWSRVSVLEPLPTTIELVTGFSEPVRRIETIQPVEVIYSPSGQTIVDFGQNLVGYVRLSNIKGPRGHKIILSHAEVLDHGELGRRPLRICKARDEYVLKGAEDGEKYEPRFTFHGFRYCQLEGWTVNLDNIEAVVCHSDMKSAGKFVCSDSLLNRLYQNICWGMRDNFLSVPTDCPQRDERLGWSGDLTMFAPTAVLLYDCFGFLKNWLVDARHDQRALGGVPSMVTPNSMISDPKWLRRIPCAIWHDVMILVPWVLFGETGDPQILAESFDSMVTWLDAVPRSKSGPIHLWDTAVYQLGDWLDPAAPPDKPWKSATDSKMVANMFLIQSLGIMVSVSSILKKTAEQARFQTEYNLARAEFQDEYVTPGGRIVSDTQTAYALAICFNLLNDKQMIRAGKRLSELVRKNQFKIATGFAGTPFVCEALARTGYYEVSYAMLLCRECPSWLYPVTMGATTVWERWDSMLPDGTINPGEMTSFNHYAFGSIAKFFHERVAGLKRVDPGWRSISVAPLISAAFSHASAQHITPQGIVSCSWETTHVDEEQSSISITVTVPYGSTAEIVLPQGSGERRENVGPGTWCFHTRFKRSKTWPVLPLKEKS